MCRPNVKARPQKVWQQGTAIDFDTVKPRKLDDFDYAITTTAAVPEHAARRTGAEVETDDQYVLWKRNGPTADTRVLNEGGDPGQGARLLEPTSAQQRLEARATAPSSCDSRSPRDQTEWSRARPVRRAGHGRDRASTLTAGQLGVLAAVPQPGPADCERMATAAATPIWSCPPRSTASTSAARAGAPSGRPGRSRCRRRQRPRYRKGRPQRTPPGCRTPSASSAGSGSGRSPQHDAGAGRRRARPGRSKRRYGLSKQCGSYIDHFTLR